MDQLNHLQHELSIIWKNENLAKCSHTVQHCNMFTWFHSRHCPGFHGKLSKQV